jgi:hypothetical protein
MCTITINPSSIVVQSLGAGASHVSVSGTVSGCTSNSVTVTIACAATAPAHGNAVITGNVWSVSTDCKCGCGTPVTITATCNDTTPCTATYYTTLVCYCCPQITTSVNNGLYNSSGQQLVTFVTQLTFPSGCTVTVQRDFGDGTPLGSIHTFTVSPASYNETHPYNTSSIYNSTVNILSMPSCGPSPGAQVNVSSPPPPCATSSFLAAFCRLLQFLFLLLAGAAGALFIAAISPVCNANPALVGVATSLAVVAGILLLILLLLCLRCVCGFFLKLMGQLLVIVGAVTIMYAPPPICVQPVPYLTPFAAFSAALLILLIGASGILYGIWYNMNRYVCPLTICDFWIAFRDALIIAILAAFIVAPNVGAGIILSALGLALLVITLLLILANQQILTNQNAGNC